MLEFVNWLRLIATVLITNSHYSSVWPVPALAMGGLLGNVLFFGVSGYCLFSVKGGFGKWYVRRAGRVVPVALVFTIVAVLTGLYPVKGTEDLVRYFLYPTAYVFLLWLMCLYVPYYFWAKLAGRSDRFVKGSLAVTVVAWILVYAFAVDKGAYVVDDVSSPFITFLYFVAMQMGGLFKKYFNRESVLKARDVLLLVVALVLYFGTKIVFDKIDGLLSVQILNQFTILAVLFATFSVFLKLEERLKQVPEKIKRVVAFVSGRTLHIYVVQFVIIEAFDGLVFPLNFVVVTALIVLGAVLLKLAEDGVSRAIARLVAKRGN